MVDLTREPYEVRTYSLVMKIVGFVVLAIAVLATSFDSYWEPVVIDFLQGSSRLEWLTPIVGSLNWVLIAAGAYCIWKSRQHPLKPSKEELECS